MQAEKNLFFGLSLLAPWSDPYPEGRVVPAESRHLTLAFLGRTPQGELLERVQAHPLPLPALAPAGVADRLLFLPEKRPRVAAVNITWLRGGEAIAALREALASYFGLSLDLRPFLSHVTLARAPFDARAWKRGFAIHPVVVHHLHLYQSDGNLIYTPLWTQELLSPFEEIEHTGDIAYTVRGKTLQELFLHAQLALATEHLPFVDYLNTESAPNTLDELVMLLDEQIARLDSVSGSPFKAVSFHGKLVEQNGLLTWEMIVDV